MPAFRRSLIPLLFIAFLAASIATAVFYGFFASKLRNVSSGASRRPIVVAARSLERGRVLTSADVKLSSWGGASPLKGGYSTVEQITGKTVYNPIEENEPVTQRSIASRDGTSGVGISTGMRAISVHASDSSGVLSLLRAGQKVDLQVVSERRRGELTLRTVLQNVEVLALNPPDSNGGRAAAPVVTLLVTPEAADQLGLADSGARIRLLLRNPLDQNEDPRTKLTLADVFSERTRRIPALVSRGRAPVTNLRGAAADPVPDVRQRIHLLVRLAAIQPQALGELGAKLRLSRNAELFQVVKIPQSGGSDPPLRALEQRGQIEILLSSDLATGDKRYVSLQAGPRLSSAPPAIRRNACGLRIGFMPRLRPDGTLRLTVQPEVTVSRSDGVAAHKMETEVELKDGQSFVLTGLSDVDATPLLTERLFPGRRAADIDRQLIVLVTAQISQPVHTVALAARH